MDTTTPQPTQAASAVKVRPEPVKPSRPSKLLIEYYGSVVLVLIAILVGAGFLVIKPKLDAWKDMRSKIQGMRDQSEIDRQYYNSLSRSVAASEGIAADVLAKVEQALPREPQIPDILMYIERLSSITGVRVTSVAFEAAKATPQLSAGVQPMVMNLSVEAPNYLSMKDFIMALESNLRLVDVQNLSFSSVEKGPWTFTLVTKTYYYQSSVRPVTGQTATPSAVPATTPVPMK